MSADLATQNGADIIERVIAAGDLAKLSPEERTRYYGEVCRSLGLNPLTKPFDYLSLSGKLVLYATRGATDQLRKIHHVSTSIVSRETVGDVYVVTARATDRAGRSDESIGAVSIGGLKGDMLCNALMKAETKAKRRATLAIVGLSFLDETEVETIPGARYGDGALDTSAPRRQAIAAQMDATVAEADALLEEPLPKPPVMQPEDFFRDEPTQHEQEQPPPGVPADDVDELTGMELLEACQRMNRRLHAQGVAFGPLPATRTNNALRQWWKLAASALAAQP